MKIIENRIKKFEMTSNRKESLMYSAQLLCEAFYESAQNEDTIYAGKDIDEVVKVWAKTFIQFIQREKMWVNGQVLMGPKDKNIRVKHFIKTLIDAIK